MAKALTVKAIEAIKPTSSRQEIPDGGLPGLYLIVQPSGAMSWAIRYRADNRPRKMTVGSYPLFGLAKAREAASASLRTVTEGRDPGAEKKSAIGARATNTVDVVLDDFIQRHVEPKNRASSAKENKRLIEVEVRAKWKDRQVKSIIRREVISLLDGIVDRGSPYTANRVHAVLRKFFNWCLERDIVDASPIANVKAPAAETSRDRVLTNEEIRLVWKAAEAVGWPFGPMTKLLLLTGQRREEVAGATWSEFDLEGAKPAWNIPKERAKNNQGHHVPLAPAAVDILKALPRIDGEKDLVFTTTGKTAVSGFSNAKDVLDRKMLELVKQEAATAEEAEGLKIAEWRLHDLRRTCASGMAALGFPVHVVEAILNHKSGKISGVAAVYNRHDYAAEKRSALFAWASQVEQLVKEAAENVVQFGELASKRAQTKTRSRKAIPS